MADSELHRPRQLAPTLPFRNFEAPQVHPLAITPDGKHLLAVNSPNATLSVFELSGGSPILTAEIPVGLQPVSVAARTDREVWVVNWLSDSVSIVDLTTGNVTRTIDVGDEPTDILFAGPAGRRRLSAFPAVANKQLTVNRSPAQAAPSKFTIQANLSAAPQVIKFLPSNRERWRATHPAGRFLFPSSNQEIKLPLIPQPHRCRKWRTAGGKSSHARRSSGGA